MKAFLIIVAILTLLFCLGWMTFATNDGGASVTIETQKVQEDTSKAVEKGKEIVEEGIEKLKSKTSEVNDTPVSDDSPKPLDNGHPEINVDVE